MSLAAVFQSEFSPNWEICEVPFDDLSCVLQKEKKPELENSNCNNVEEICSSCHWCNTAETAKYIIAVQYIYIYICVCVCVCFVCWLELDSSIALCNLSSLYATSSSKYSGLFSTIIALNQTQLSNHRTDQFWILANQITKFEVSINRRNVYLYVFQNNLPFLKCSIII